MNDPIQLIINLSVLAFAAFIQNIFFTWVSRSRNSGDVDYHKKIAFFSNGVWFICHCFVINQVWKTLTTGDWLSLILTGLVYSLFTANGSAFMMKWLLKHEKGKRRVGAR